MFLRLREITGGSVVGIDRKLWGETGELRLPVEQQTAWHDDECRSLDFRVDGGQHRDGLQCLAQAHVVGQATAQLIVIEIAHPFHALFLVGAKLRLHLGEFQFLILQLIETVEHLPVMRKGLPFEPLLQLLLDFR